MFAASTILYKMIVCLSESRGGSSIGESIFSYCGQRYCYCQLSSSVIFRQYGVSQSECKIDRTRPGLPRVSPRPHTEALGTRLVINMSF